MNMNNVKKLEDICKFETSSQAINLAKELFLKEVAKRYFNATQRSVGFAVKQKFKEKNI